MRDFGNLSGSYKFEDSRARETSKASLSADVGVVRGSRVRGVPARKLSADRDRSVQEDACRGEPDADGRRTVSDFDETGAHGNSAATRGVGSGRASSAAVTGSARFHACGGWPLAR